MTKKNIWSVCKRKGKWRINCNGHWHDTADTHAEAMTLARRYAIANAAMEGVFESTMIREWWRD